MKSDVPLLLRYGGIGLLFVGILVVLMMGLAWVCARDARTWPAVDGRVIRSEIDVSKKIVPLGRFRRTHVEFYALRIEYEYEVDGQRFTGDRVTLAANPCGYDRAEVERWTRKYPLGGTISVHYSPTHPEHSVVERTGGPAPWGFALGILAVVGGLVMRHIGKRALPPKPTPARRPVRQAPPPPPVQRQPVPSPQPRRPRASRRTHWSIRTVGVLLGLGFLLIGAACLPVAVAEYTHGGVAGSPGDATPAAKLAVTVIMGLLVLLGAWLVWIGMKRASQPVNFGSPPSNAPPIPPGS